MPANGLTKQLTHQQFKHFRTLINLQDIKHKLLKAGDTRASS